MSDAAVRTARCTCGTLSAVCRGEPPRVSVCNCLDCMRRTGSAFAWNATYAEDQVVLSGEAASFTRTGDEGRWCTFHFCPECGDTLWYRIEARRGMVTIPAGAFADPGFPEPTVSVYGERRSPWVKIEPSGGLTEY